VLVLILSCDTVKETVNVKIGLQTRFYWLAFPLHDATVFVEEPIGMRLKIKIYFSKHQYTGVVRGNNI